MEDLELEMIARQLYESAKMWEEDWENRGRNIDRKKLFVDLGFLFTICVFALTIILF